MQNLIHEKILKNISAGTIYVKKGKINYVNPAAEFILGKTSAEMLNKPFAGVFIDYDENDNFNQIVIDAISDYKNAHEKIVQYFDGEKIKHLHIKTSILHDGEQKFGILILMDDITELMKLRGVELDLQRIKDINQELALRNLQLKKESETDKLTGLLNKKTMENLCADFLQSLNGNSNAAFFMIDLDHFKEANDTYGHATGDMILQIFANSLREIFNENSYIGRFGGDEFSVLLKNSPNENFFAEKACAILDAAKNIFIEGMEIQITASIGVAAVSAAVEYKKAFELADGALYFVKEHGRNNFHIAQN